jgi:hypothetical protein
MAITRDPYLRLKNASLEMTPTSTLLIGIETASLPDLYPDFVKQLQVARPLAHLGETPLQNIK